MKAAVAGEQGVEIRDVAKPVPKPHEILIKVRAASLNRADLAVAAGHRHGTVGGPAGGCRPTLHCPSWRRPGVEVPRKRPEAIRRQPADSKRVAFEPSGPPLFRRRV